MVAVKAQIAPLRERLEGEIRELKASNITLEQQHSELQRDMLQSAARLEGEIRELKASNVTLEQQHSELQRDMLLSAATLGDDRMVSRLLYQTGVSVGYVHPHSGGNTMLHAAAGKGHVEVVKLLINKGSDMNQRTTTAPGETHR